MKEKGKAEEVEKSASEFFDKLMQPHLLPGEDIIAHAENALRYSPYSDRKKGISGNLFVSNFKVSFVTADKSSYAHNEAKSHQRNKLLDDNDIPLTCIESIYQVMSGGKRRPLVLGQTISSTCKYLEIHCKDFRIHLFGFKFVPKDQNKRVTNTILHHSCPKRDELLFAYDFGQNGTFAETSQGNQFHSKEDWEDELKRLGCDKSWRVADINTGFQKSASLPEYFVVPQCLMNTDLLKAIGQFSNERMPIWSYTYPDNGASLVRMSHIHIGSDFKPVEEMLLSAVKMAASDPLVLDLTPLCPTIAEIRNSYQRLLSLCMIDSVKEFYSLDSSWLSRLESTQWLQLVGTCLKVSAEIAEHLTNKRTVALKEETGFDLCCVISCLVQLILDPYCRTLYGFSSLVQREWVVMGHPFQKRNRLVHGPDGEQSPVFLLFLDCVWQLLQQYPSRLAFTETYLTTLWDTMQIGVTDTFLFNNAHQRHNFKFRLNPVWNWSLQFSEEDVLLFNNPLFSLNTICDLEAVIASARGSLKRSGHGQAPNGNSYHRNLSEYFGNSRQGWGKDGLFKKPTSDVLLPVYTTTFVLQLWSQCYLRWSVPAQILGGGLPARYLQQCLLVEEVICLDHKLKLLQEQRKSRQLAEEGAGEGLNVASPQRLLRPQSGLVFSLDKSPLSPLDSIYLTSSFPFPAAVTAQTQHKLINGPLSLYLHDSLVQYDYADSED